MNTLFKTIAAAGLILLAVSCSDDYTVQDNPLTTDGEEVMVNLNYSVQALVSGDGIESTDALTREVPIDIADGTNIPIKNMFIIQFDGILPDSKMIGATRFLSTTDLAVTQLSVPLIEKTNTCYTVFVANIAGGSEYNWNLSKESTFSDVVKRVKALSSEDDTYKTIGGEKTLLLSAVTKDPVTSSLYPVFKRNVAKITLGLTLDNSEMEIISVRLRNISRTITYADAALSEIISATESYPTDVTVMDYGAITTGLPANTETKYFSWYVPRNQRGTDSRSTAAWEKTLYAPAYATYFEIIAVKRTSGTITSTTVFRVYPGANQIDDFNLIPNNHYTFGLTVKDDGIDPYDSRVQKFEDRDLTNSGAKSNCFIINPAPVGDATIKYNIPITQVNRFWGNSYAGYGNNSANVIGGTDPWAVELIWCDTDNLFSTTYSTSLISLTNNNGGNPGTGIGPGQFFQLSIPAGMPTGNFTLGLRKNNGEILWSWHFWVTDYNPDKFNSSMIAPGKYTYPVPGGQVERYVDNGTTLWSTTYKNSVMMDRALGADDEYFKSAASNSKKGILHYQFGRKDPFPSCTTTSVSKSVIRTDGAVTVQKAVTTPNVFYYISGTAGNWCTEVRSAGITWNDPQSTGQFKSIYDPCPPGWCVPLNGVWSDFNSKDNNGTFITVQNAIRDLAWGYGRGIGTVTTNVNGLRYWPGTTASASVGGTIWYPASGWRNSTDGFPTSGGSYGYYWSDTANSDTSGRYLYFLSGNVTPSSGSYRTAGFAVRCISE